MKITFLSVRVMQVVQIGNKKFLSYLFQRYQKSQMHYANKRKIVQIIFGVTISVKILIVSQALKNVLHDYFLLKNDKKKYPLLSSKIK